LILDFTPLTLYEIIGIIVTASTAIVAYLTSREDAKGRNTAIASVIGVIFTIATGIRFDMLPKLQASLEPGETIRNDRRRSDLLQKVARVNAAQAPINPLMTMVLKIRLESLQEQFDAMAQGRFIVDEAEMPVFNMEMIRTAKREIRTTNFIGISRWWEQPWGERYELANEAAAERKVRITRTFIFSKAEDVPIAAAIMTRQAKKGIAVRYALLRELQPLTGDVIAIDGVLVGEHRIIPGRGLSEALFSVNAGDIERDIRILDAVETNSRDWIK
jgi:hypothetical protein